MPFQMHLPALVFVARLLSVTSVGFMVPDCFGCLFDLFICRGVYAHLINVVFKVYSGLCFVKTVIFTVYFKRAFGYKTL